VRRIQESFERSPRKSTGNWNTATNRLACVEAPFTVQLSPYFESPCTLKNYTNKATKTALLLYNLPLTVICFSDTLPVTGVLPGNYS